MDCDSSNLNLDAHQFEIWCLYLKENLSLQDVIDTMKSRHGIDATKAQYEKKFGEWGFFKNLSPDEWRDVIRRVQRRLPKKSALILSGVKLPSPKVRKATQRYGYQTTLERFRPASPTVSNVHQTSRVLIHTPPSTSMEPLWRSRIPWLTFVEEHRENMAILAKGLPKSQPDGPLLTLFKPYETAIQHRTTSDMFSKITMIFNTFIPEREPPEISSKLMEICCGIQTGTWTAPGVEVVFNMMSNSVVEPTPQLDAFLGQSLKDCRLMQIWTKLMIESPHPTAQCIAEFIYGSVVRIGDTKALSILLEIGADLTNTVRPAYLANKPGYDYFRKQCSLNPLTIALGNCKSDFIKFLLTRWQWPRQPDGSVALPEDWLRPLVGYYEQFARPWVLRHLLPWLTSSNIEGSQWHWYIEKTFVGILSPNKDDKELLDLLLDRIYFGRLYTCPRDLNVILIGALRNRRDDLIEMLLKEDVDYTHDIEYFRLSILRTAVDEERSDVCERLLDMAALRDTRERLNILGDCLWYAASKGRGVECMSILLKHGADPNYGLRDNPRTIADHSNFASWMPCLKKWKTRFLETPLRQAVRMAAGTNDIEALTLLVQNGASMAGEEIFYLLGCGGSDPPLTNISEAVNENTLELSNAEKYFLSIGTLGRMSAIQIQTCLGLAIREHRNGLAMSMVDFLCQTHGFVYQDLIKTCVQGSFQENNFGLLHYLQKKQALDFSQVLRHAQVLAWNDNHHYINEVLGGVDMLDDRERVLVARVCASLGDFDSADIALRGMYDAEVLCYACLRSFWTDDTTFVSTLIERRRRRNTFPNTESCTAEGVALVIVISLADWFLLQQLIHGGIRGPSVPDVPLFLIELGDITITPEEVEWTDTAEELREFLETAESEELTSLMALALRLRVAYNHTTVARLFDMGIVFCNKDFEGLRYEESPELFFKFVAKLPTSAARSQEGMMVLSMAMRKWGRPIYGRELVDTIDRIYCADNDLFDSDDGPEHPVKFTVLQSAALVGDMELVKLLLEKGADVNHRAFWARGATALQAAVINGSIGIVRLLLEQGADCDAPRAERHGRTALEAAAEHGRLDIINLLVSNGARIDGPGQDQYIRAICFAESQGRRTVAQNLTNMREWTSSDGDLYKRWRPVAISTIKVGPV